MEDKLVKTISLENGLVLKLYDKSKQIADDRWLVVLFAKTDVPVQGSFLDGEDSGITINKVKDALGEVLVFEQKRERNFVDENRKESVFKELCASFLDSSLYYLSHPDFPKRFVFKKYKEFMKKESLYAAYRERNDSQK